MTKTMWRVAAGRGGRFIGAYLSQSIVTLGWRALGDMTRFATREELLAAARLAFPTRTERQIQNGAAQAWRFMHAIQIEDDILSYDPSERVYHLGRIKGLTRYQASDDEELELARPVVWESAISRDNLSIGTRNSLGAIQTLIKVPEAAARELRGDTTTSVSDLQQNRGNLEEEALVAEADPYAELFEKSVGRVTDLIHDLDPYQLQDLVAALLRALGYRTQVSALGADRGKDIVASRDGFGFERPRIVVEVKHRRGKMGAPDIRAFVGGRHADDRGLYVSTGGFSQEARYEAERSSTLTHLMDLDELARAVIAQYDGFDEAGRALLPLRRLYWPADGAQ